jgi:hypothetical protein
MRTACERTCVGGTFTNPRKSGWLGSRGVNGPQEDPLYAALVPAIGLWRNVAGMRRRRLMNACASHIRAIYRCGTVSRTRASRREALLRRWRSSVLCLGEVRPVWIRAQSMLYLARAHDLAGRRSEAIKLTRRSWTTTSRKAPRSARVWVSDTLSAPEGDVRRAPAAGARLPTCSTAVPKSSLTSSSSRRRAPSIPAA